MRKIQALAKNRKNTLIDFVNADLHDLLMAADLLISDANSCAEEALFYSTPQLFTGLGNSSYESLKNGWVAMELHEEDLDDMSKLFECGPIYAEENYENWDVAVHDAIQRKDQFSDKRELCFNLIFGQRDRNAGRRVADILRREYL